MSFFIGRRKHQEGAPWIKKHSLSIAILFAILLTSVVSIISGHIDWIATQASHGQQVTGWPMSFWIWWLHQYSTSIAAEPHGIFLGLWLGKIFFEPNQEESVG